MMIVLIFYTNFLLDRPISLWVRIFHFSFQLSIWNYCSQMYYLILIKRVDGTGSQLKHYRLHNVSVPFCNKFNYSNHSGLNYSTVDDTHFDRPAKYSQLQKYRNRIEQDLHFFCEWGKIEK